MPARSSGRALFVLFALLVAAAGVLGAYQGTRYRAYLAETRGIPLSTVTIFSADYWMGELVEGIVARGEYRGCYATTASAQPATVGLCMSAHRMPVVPVFMAAVAVLFNDIVFYLALKCAVAMALLCLAAALVLRQTEDWRLIGGALLAVYVLCPPNILIFSGMVSEESFFIPQMALAGAVLFSRRPGESSELSGAALMALAVLVAAMVMTKSSALLPAGAIAALLALRLPRRGAMALLPLASLVSVLLAWGAFTYHATGKFAFAGDLSSLNGYNLHHGYTKYFGEVAPRYHLDVPVWRGQINLDKPVGDEWEMNRQFKDRAMAFVAEHPGTSLWYLAIKAYAAFIKLTPEYRLQSGEDGFFLPKHLILTAGLVLDRAVLWLSLIASSAICWRALRRGGVRSLIADPPAFDGVMLLAVSLAYMVPFVIAFSTFRHIVPLYYFQLPYLVAVLLRSSLLEDTRWGARLSGLAGRPPPAAAAASG